MASGKPDIPKGPEEQLTRHRFTMAELNDQCDPDLEHIPNAEEQNWLDFGSVGGELI